jgi:hypothetical protein
MSTSVYTGLNPFKFIRKHFLHFCVRKVAVHSQKVLQVMSTGVEYRHCISTYRGPSAKRLSESTVYSTLKGMIDSFENIAASNSGHITQQCNLISNTNLLTKNISAIPWLNQERRKNCGSSWRFGNIDDQVTRWILRGLSVAWQWAEWGAGGAMVRPPGVGGGL